MNTLRLIKNVKHNIVLKLILCITCIVLIFMNSVTAHAESLTGDVISWGDFRISVTQSSSDGGAACVDWSSYSYADKYFKVYKRYVPVSNDTYNNTITYTFNHDMYSDNTVIVYAIDSCGNLSSQSVEIDKIDATIPHITHVDVKNLYVTITADDFNSAINATGSGVRQYGYLKVDTDSSISWVSSDTFGLPRGGTYEIFVKDGAGNISEPYTVTVQ